MSAKLINKANFSGFSSRSSAARAMRERQSRTTGAALKGPVQTSRGWVYYCESWDSAESMAAGDPHTGELWYGARNTACFIRGMSPDAGRT